MADNDSKRYYWLKLQKDFFKRHDIRIVESMQNGKDYILFYLKLLCESTSHNGELRFNETIPYNEDMLSTITNTNVDIVRQAIKIFEQLGMIELFDDGTLYMVETQKMLGSETGSAIRKREYRRSIETSKGQCLLEIEKDIEIEKEIDNKKQKFVKPSTDDVSQYCKERNNNIDPQSFVDYYESVGWKVGNKPMKDWKATIRTWEQRHKSTKEDVIPKYDDFNEELRRRINERKNNQNN